MKRPEKQKQENKKGSDLEIFPVPLAFALEEIKKDISDSLEILHRKLIRNDKKISVKFILENCFAR